MCRYDVLTQEPVTVAEQPVTELSTKMVNKKQVEGSVPILLRCNGILLRCNGEYVGSATLDCRYLRYHKLLPTPLHAKRAHLKPFGRLFPFAMR